MKTLYFDRNTLLNSHKNNVDIAFNVSDDFVLRKEVEEIECHEQECNELGEPLFLRDIYTKTPTETVVGQEEVVEVTENPVMIDGHLKNAHGDFLYIENVYEDNVLSGTTETTEAVSENGEENIPLFVTIHKCNDDGELLYIEEEFVGGNMTSTETTSKYDDEGYENEPAMAKYPKVSFNGEPLYLENVYMDHVLMGTKEVTRAESEFEEANKPLIGKLQKRDEEGMPLYYKDVVGMVIKEEFSHTEKTTRETDNPIMIPKMKVITKDVFVDEGYFHIDEVAENSIQSYIEGTQSDCIICEMLLHESEWDLENSFANTGLGIVNLPVNGYIKTKSIELEIPTAELTIKGLEEFKNIVEVTMNDTVVGADGVVKFETTVNDIIVTIKNVSGKPVDIKPYNILY